ncbi:MAG: TatD family hydrolase [Acidobacteriota bacterium]
MNLSLIDSHCHLDSPEFEPDLDQVVQRAQAAGISRMITIGCLGSRAETPSRLLQILECYPMVAAACGVHPHDARHYDDGVEESLLELLKHPRVVAVGEIGLDFHYDFSPRDIQREVFRRQIAVAREAGKPVILHTREADLETAQILADEFPACAGDSGILHCFPGGEELERIGLERGFSFGFGGVVTFRKADAVRLSLSRIPAERLVLETDAPYLAPVPFRGKRNEPSFVRQVAEEVARLRGMTLEETARLTTVNCLRLFPGLDSDQQS